MPTRSRHQDSSNDVISGITWQSDPDTVAGETTGEHPWYSGDTMHPFPKHISWITDVSGEPHDFHAVDHLVVDSYLTGMQTFGRYPGVNAIVRHQGDSCAFPLTELHGSFREWPWIPSFSDSDLSDFAIDAFNKFHDQVPTSVSLANFLYELKDMKGMIPSIDKKSISKTASNNFLAFEFGVLPFVSDIKAILDMSAAVDKRLQHLIEMNGKTSKLTFERTLVVEGPSMTFSRSLYDPRTQDTDTPGGFVRFVGNGGKCNLRIGASLQQDLTGLKDAMSTMKALAASGGFNHPARVVWNAIPYSFVVDWFFHVGKLLDSLTIQPFGGEYNVSNVGYSVKSTATFTAHQIHTNGTVPVDNTLGTVRASRYIRKPGFPASSLFLTNGTLTPMQQVLALAMLNQRRR